MKLQFLNPEAGFQFISPEIQEFLNILVMGVPNWKWLTLILSVLGLYFIRRILVWVTIKLKTAQSYFPKQTFMKNFLDQEVEKGFSWVIVSIAALIIFDTLALSANLDKYLTLAIKLFLSFNVIRICYLAAEAFGISIQAWAATTSSDLDDHLAPFATKTLKIAVVITGVLVALQNFGVNVTALIAGLGIGGVAIAFAAQDTVANVFGTITILLDSPFKMGDTVKIGDTEGAIVDIGFRSTHIKTYYNSVVAIPNSTVAKEKIDNLTRRENWIRFNQTMGFTYDAKPEQIDQFCTLLKTELQKKIDIDQERIAIHLSAFADFSVNVAISFHYKIQEGEIIAARNENYLKLIYQISQQAGLAFAFPTQTLIVQKSPAN